MILSGGLPPLLLHCRSTFTSSSSSSPLLPSTNCFFSINFVSWDAYRLHEQLPRRLPPAISLSFSRPLRRLLIARPIVLGSCFFPKTVLYLRETRSLLVILRSSTCQFLRSPSILDINRIFSGGEGLGGACFRCYKLILIGVYDNLYGSHSLLLRDEESLLNFDRDTFLYLFSSVEGNL